MSGRTSWEATPHSLFRESMRRSWKMTWQCCKLRGSCRDLKAMVEPEIFTDRYRSVGHGHAPNRWINSMSTQTLSTRRLQLSGHQRTQRAAWPKHLRRYMSQAFLFAISATSYLWWSLFSYHSYWAPCFSMARPLVAFASSGSACGSRLYG